LTTLLSQGYRAFAASLLAERQEAHLPPFSWFALIRAEAVDQSRPATFLRAVRDCAAGDKDSAVTLLGPAPALMEKRAGRYRAHLLLQTTQRDRLHRLVERLIPQIDALPAARRVRWSLDIDPIDML
jgi:primosomal protein N' (replication factor Y)